MWRNESCVWKRRKHEVNRSSEKTLESASQFRGGASLDHRETEVRHLSGKNEKRKTMRKTIRNRSGARASGVLKLARQRWRQEAPPRQETKA
jgi:hypothetical protein